MRAELQGDRELHIPLVKAGLDAFKTPEQTLQALKQALAKVILDQTH